MTQPRPEIRQRFLAVVARGLARAEREHAEHLERLKPARAARAAKKRHRDRGRPISDYRTSKGERQP